MADCSSLTHWKTVVTLSGVHCFSAQGVETDEAYAIISLVALNGNKAGGDEMVKVVRLPITNVKSRQNIWQNTTIGQMTPTGAGLKIAMQIWDHESGDADEIRDKVQAVLIDAANKGAQLLTGGAIADDLSVTGGTVGDVTQFEIGGVKPIMWVTLGLSEVITNWLADDFIGENEYFIPSQNLEDFKVDTPTYDASLRVEPPLEFDAPVNWPPRPDLVKVFGGGDGEGCYKAYFKITLIKDDVICDPKLQI